MSPVTELEVEWVILCCTEQLALWFLVGAKTEAKHPSENGEALLAACDLRILQCRDPLFLMCETRRKSVSRQVSDTRL